MMMRKMGGKKKNGIKDGEKSIGSERSETAEERIKKIMEKNKGGKKGGEEVVKGEDVGNMYIEKERGKIKWWKVKFESKRGGRETQKEGEKEVEEK